MTDFTSLAEKYRSYSGRTLGNYSLESLEGAFEIGPIFRARHNQAKTFHRLYLLELPSVLTPEDRLIYLGQFQQEAAQVATLRHPLLLPVTDYGIYQRLPYLVSPDMALRSLQEALASSGPMQASLAGHYLDQLATALEYLYQQGVLHLNLHARCIFFKEDGGLMVAEAGLLRMLNPQIHATSVQSLQATTFSSERLPYGLSVASAPAPEQILGRPVDASTDVYGLGAVLYQMLTGHRVFRGDTLPEIAQQHLKSAVPSLSLWRRDLPRELDPLLASALAKESDRRVPRVGTLANAHHQIVAPGDARRKPFAMSEPAKATPVVIQPSAVPIVTSARAVSPALHSSQRTKKRISRRRMMTLVAAGGSAVVVAGATAWLVERSNSAPAASIAATSPGAGAGSGNGGTATSSQDGTVLANVSQVPVNSAKPFSLPGSAGAGVIVHLVNNSFVAFNSTCTHAGCTVHYNSQDHLLECPCHGAAFDPAKNAAVVAGPAPSPLAPVPIVVNNNGTITLKQ